MIKNEIARPKIVGRDEWLTARKTLLEHEKEYTKHRDRINAERRRLPMVKLEKDYTFEGSNGSVKLIDLFAGRTQLIIYHFMFDPTWDRGCMGCTGYVDALGDLSMLNDRDTTFALVSRAPLPKLEAYKRLKGWTVPWYSSFGSNFNYDFYVTLDENVAPIEYNYRDKAQMEERSGSNVMQGESHGLSVFFRIGNDIFHTYSTYARGVESLTDAYSLLDTTPYGRQEDFEDSPPGYPQQPTYG
ncbi:DUF899 domain-containing protein [Phormidesmis priestleyi ULC007]|uniref:DUF899 domain-containing protein n=1 Tax=Phormidesmis priestleyi ULC007 TaxID=1920490 RepID=A0A2T1D8F6_9CYAN|nr:DUF899 domain-containing protein [Phormidesmis priestleyi]PSB16780.1 DUF899 domain-containing protein [Phormidesmis priestleyi ULC007]PZO47663.1 MAG: DUF899 domain-containing protein [Phormidesmis priestleyi]